MGARAATLVACYRSMLPNLEVVMRRHAPGILAAVILLAMLAEPAAAQRYRTRSRARVGVVLVPSGLYVGGGLLGTAILSQDGGPELLDNGVGLTLFGGVRLNRRLALELGWMASFHNPASVETYYGDDVDYLVLNGLTGDAKIYLDSKSPSGEPFLQGGLGLYFIDSTYFGTQSVGTGFQLGGGYDFFIAPAVSLGVRALYRGIAMGPPESVRDDTFISAVTIDGNLKIDF
jgi:hypothetical protein